MRVVNVVFVVALGKRVGPLQRAKSCARVIKLPTTALPRQPALEGWPVFLPVVQ